MSGSNVSIPRLCQAIAKTFSTEFTLVIPAETGDPSGDELKNGFMRRRVFKSYHLCSLILTKF